MTGLEVLAQVASREQALSTDERIQARRPVLDTLAVAVAARDEPVVEAAHRLARSTVAVNGRHARSLTTGQKLPVGEAAFVNGVAGHALDFDDVSMAMSGHPSTLLVPVTLAIAESADATVHELLEAYSVGLRVNLAVSAGFDFIGHYNRGWHASVTVGSLGATAAAARLLGLTREETLNALGIAVSMAAGTRQNFGTMTKPLHIGLAANNAVRAATLAMHGVDASSAALDGPLGFYNLYGTDIPQDSRSADGLIAAIESGTSAALATLSVKRYPCCYQTHRAIDASLDVRAALDEVYGVDDIASVVVCVNPGSDTSLIHEYATTATEGRFCLRYAVAKALLDGRVDFGSFTDAEVAGEAVQELMRRIDVRYSVDPPFDLVEYDLDYAAVKVTLTSGTSGHITCTAPRGNASRPLSDESLVDKANLCLERGDHQPDASELWNLLGMRHAHVSDIVDIVTQLAKKR